MMPHRPDPDDPGAPVHEPVAGPPAVARRRPRACWPGSSTPSCTPSIVDLGMVDDVAVEPDGARHREGRAHHRRLPAARPDQARTSSRRCAASPASPTVEVEYGEMTAGAEDGGDAARPLQRPRERGDPPRCRRPRACSRSRAARAASASRRSPSTSPPRSRRAGLTVGVLDADIWGFSVPRMLGVEGRLGGTDGKIDAAHVAVPNRRRDGDAGTLKVVSMGFLVDDEGTALDVARADPHQGARAVPHRRALGRDRLPPHRHAARHRRHPDGPGAHAARRPRCSWSPRPRSPRRRSRRASPTWPAAPT